MTFHVTNDNGEIDLATVNQLTFDQLSEWVHGRLHGKDPFLPLDRSADELPHFLFAELYPQVDRHIRQDLERVVAEAVIDLVKNPQTQWQGEAAHELLLLVEPTIRGGRWQASVVDHLLQLSDRLCAREPAHAAVAGTSAVDESDANLARQPIAADAPVEELVQVCKLLSDATRLGIVVYLLESEEMDFSDLCKKLGSSQPAVSHHLALLRVSGLVQQRREGKFKYYSVSESSLRRLAGTLFESFSTEHGELHFNGLEPMAAQSGTEPDLHFRVLQTIVALGHRLNDGFWRDVYAQRRGRYAILAIEGLALLDSSQVFRWLADVEWSTAVHSALFNQLPVLLEQFGSAVIRRDVEAIWDQLSLRAQAEVMQLFAEEGVRISVGEFV